MPSLWESLSSVAKGSEEVVFLNSVLKKYREVRKVYNYEYTQEDRQALRVCSTDLRPLTYSFVPALGTYWAAGKLFGDLRKRGLGTRAFGVLTRLVVAGEVFRLGYLVGLHQQGVDCTRHLVQLQTPLGGEIVAIIRDMNPSHPLLRLERPPAELAEDGSRPRIATDANRDARIASLKRELAMAKQGQSVDRSSELTDERLFEMVEHRQRALQEIRKAGGAADATNREEYGDAAAAAGLYRASHDNMDGALGRTAQERLTGLTPAQQPLNNGNAGLGSDDPLVWLTGSGSSSEWGNGDADEAQMHAADAEAARRRKHRRQSWWWRHGA